MFGVVGGGADVSWHFSRLFDEFSPPHDIAAVGIVGNIVLLYWALWRNRAHVAGVERQALVFAAVSMVVNLVAIPLDLLWHLLFGIDVTTWSPTHLLLDYSAMVGFGAMMVAWLASRDRDKPGAWILTTALGALLLTQVLFPLYQQEYAAVAVAYFERTGHAPWYIAPEVWAFAGRQAVDIAHGTVPDGLYITYQTLVASIVLTLVAVLVRASMRWTDERLGRTRHWWSGAGAATGITIAYLLFRLAIQGVFLLFGLPHSVIPVWLLPLGLAVDAAMLLAVALPELRVPDWLPFTPETSARARRETMLAAAGGLVGALALYGTFVGVGLAGIPVPDTPIAAAIVALLLGALGGAGGALLAERIVDVVGMKPVRLAPLPLSGTANRLIAWGQAALAHWRH